MATPLLQIEELCQGRNHPIPGYYVRSTAPIFVEGPQQTQQSSKYQAEQGVAIATDSVQKIAAQLYEASQHGTPELILSIHGYNTDESYARYLYDTVCDYVNQDSEIRNAAKTLLFVGYRWPSDQIKLNRLVETIQAMPIFLVGVLVVGLLGTVVSLGCLLAYLVSQEFLRPFLVLIVPSLLFLLPIVTLVLLRISGYFQDLYRATNFGVPDLVEFIRQVDLEVMNLTPGASQTEKEAFWQARPQQKIKLTFIGHSMGGFVTTHAVRILSDVFDSRSIGTLDADEPNKLPSSELGHVFSLGRMILVSPDIPMDVILAGRSNYLLSALRRFEEAYLFSNEGDMVLRLASTAANSFSFPNRTRESGYRLGNVAIKNSEPFGIINLASLQSQQAQPSILQSLFVNSLSSKRSLEDLQKEFTLGSANSGEALANLFTLIDCTEYKDQIENGHPSSRAVGVLTHAPRRRGPLTLFDYLRLTVDTVLGKRDTHGGYFKGKFTKQMIYRLAFLSFGGLLDAIAAEQPELIQAQEQAQRAEIDQILTQLTVGDRSSTAIATTTAQDQQVTTSIRRRLAALFYLAQECKNKGLQTFLSLERYQVDVLLQSTRKQFKCEVLNSPASPNPSPASLNP